MSYQEITMARKQNVSGNCVPFCIEHVEKVENDVLHIHDFHQLTVVTHGSATLVLNGVSYPVRTGDAYVISSFSAHFLKDMRELEFVNVLFYLKDLEANCGALVQTEGFRALFCVQPIHEGQVRPDNIISMDYGEIETVTRLLKQLLMEQRSELPGKDLMIQSCFLMLITYLTRMQRRTAAHLPTTHSYQLRQAVEYLEANCANAVTLSDISEACNMTQRQLRNLFERVYGCTPLRYLWNIRIRKACVYLASTDLPIADIAALTGFEDSNYFSRRFRQALGMTPRDYRLRSYSGEADEMGTAENRTDVVPHAFQTGQTKRT